MIVSGDTGFNIKSVSRFLLAVLVPSLLVAAAPRKPAAKIAGAVSIIRDVAVVDVVNGQITPHQDIVIRGDRIEEVCRTAAPSNITRYAIPGLWDMHVHLWDADPQFPSYLANGVTGVRDMGSDLDRVRKWQKEIAAGRLAPRIYTSGAPLNTTPSEDPKLPVTVIRTPDDARRAFDHYYDLRVDFIKVLDLPAAAFEALAEMSRHGGVPFAGHLPDSVSAFSAAEGRMVTMEHLYGIALACSSREPELRQRLLNAEAAHDRAELTRVREEIRASFDDAKASRLWDLFRRYNVYQTPTLTMLRRENPDTDFAFELTKSMAMSGVAILAGTDTGDPGTVPGVTLHEELRLLVKAGLTPAQALRAATWEPARLMRLTASLGQIRAGYLADLVILKANPLDDIANTEQIEEVIAGGKPVQIPGPAASHT